VLASFRFCRISISCVAFTAACIGSWSRGPDRVARFFVMQYMYQNEEKY
jgi:hypothetical protein